MDARTGLCGGARSASYLCLCVGLAFCQQQARKPLLHCEKQDSPTLLTTMLRFVLYQYTVNTVTSISRLGLYPSHTHRQRQWNRQLTLELSLTAGSSIVNTLSCASSQQERIRECGRDWPFPVLEKREWIFKCVAVPISRDTMLYHVVSYATLLAFIC